MTGTGEQSVPDFSSTFKPIGPYPFEDTHNLRHGPDLHPDLLPLLPYIGVWRGRGQGGYPGIEDFTYGQEVRISHDGRPFLYYESRTWLVDADDEPVRPASREVGWFRVLGDKGKKTEVELELSNPTGIMELYYGNVDGTTVELATDAVLRSPSAKEVTAGKRLYGIVEGALMYAAEMAAMGHPLTPHLSARLQRIEG
ncbi:FABP family protein [Stackebrandtia soli]|uniref:FABP family protein n=1 Tax=Stackebrandtia soli TaxID=1892856 RepID=UPI0039E76833